MKSIWTYIALVGAIIVSLAAGILQATGASVLLQWDAPVPDTNVSGYVVYYGSAGSRQYTKLIDAGNLTHCVIPDLEVGGTWCFAVTAYSISGNESEYSPELAWFSVKPQNVRGDGLVLNQGVVK